MDTGRRSFVRGTLFALGAAGGLLAGQHAPPSPYPAPREPEPLSKPDSRALLKASQKEIKRDVLRLAELAEQLRKEVEKTDSGEILSLSLVRKAEEIEKLARTIKNLARG